MKPYNILLILTRYILSLWLVSLVGPVYSDTLSPVNVQLLQLTKGVGQDVKVPLVLRLSIAPGWKVAGAPPHGTYGIGIPPALQEQALDNIEKVTWQWPEPVLLDWQGVKGYVYTGTIDVPGYAVVKNPGNPIRYQATLTVLACNKLCQPLTVPISVSVPAGPATAIAIPPLPQANGWFVWLGMVLLALLGGLILNLMPCVLPVLSLKLLSLTTTHQGKCRQTQFSVTFLGILSSFWILAALVLLLRQIGVAVGWGMHFQNPVFLGIMAIIMFAFAGNLLGLFEIPLPRWINVFVAQPTTEKQHSYFQDFLSGVLATLLATPCSAPFLGTAVSYALGHGAFEIVTIFTGLGLGFGAPYLALAFLPLNKIKMPKPGQWMIRLRQSMGIGLFLSGFWVASMLWPQFYAPSVESGPKTGKIAWVPFKEADIQPHVAAGKIVFVDITAQWCMTCIYNKKVVLERSPVVEQLQQAHVVPMQGDWTNQDANILAFLQKHNRYGIPFNMVYGPGCPAGEVLPELLKARDVEQSLSHCR
jgi:thiol:disulfide interchange protein